MKKTFDLLKDTERLLTKARQNLDTLQGMDVRVVTEHLQRIVAAPRQLEIELAAKKRQLLTLLIQLCILADRTTIPHFGGHATVIMSAARICDKDIVNDCSTNHRDIDEVLKRDDVMWLCQEMVDRIRDYLINPKPQNDVTAFRRVMKELSDLSHLSPLDPA
jgi:hypothetical protein